MRVSPIEHNERQGDTASPAASAVPLRDLPIEHGERRGDGLPRGKGARWRANIALLLLCVAGLVVCRHTLIAAAQRAKVEPPRAERIPKVVEIHGDRRVDDYYWLREKSNPKVSAYLKAENEYAEAMMASTADLQEKLHEEFISRLQETDQSAPYRHGEYFYYTRADEGNDYTLHCRKKGSLKAPEELLLDENDLAEDEDFFALGAFEVSPNHQRLAFSLDTSGAERYTLHFKDLKTGELFDEEIEDTFETVAWAADNETCFYVTLDDASRPSKVYRHKLGDDPAKDVLIYSEPDKAFFVGVSNTNSRAFVLMDIESNTTREVRFLPADKPLGEFTLVEPRRKQIQYLVEHHGERFFILTNDGATNFKLVETPTKSPGKEHWRDVIPHRPDIKLEALAAFAGHLVISQRVAGVPAFEVRDLKSGESHTVTFPEPSYTLEAGPIVEFDTTTLRFSYQSHVTPNSVYDYDLAARTRELKKQDKVQGGYDPAKYASERIWATASDGTRVPISLVHKKDLPRDGKSPCYLQGYGAYGMSEDPLFDADLISLLDRGFVVGIAHVRGGGELGRKWYDDGKLAQKKNSFSDFIACVEHLIKEKYTSPDRLAIYGGSAGGLLVGGVVNMRPDLFRVVIADVPFVDVLNTMLDPTIPLTVTEYEEWGNPNEKPLYDAMRAYSPYDNVKPQKYPHFLILAGLNDTRVSYWEPAKWAARLRATKTDDNLLLLKANLTAGHGGASGRFEALQQRAFEYAFLLDRLGMK